jgi:repressor LexA
MKALTNRQQKVLEYIQDTIQMNNIPPTLREICDHFGFKSVKAASDHVAALRRKGMLVAKSHQARSLQVISPLRHLRKPIRDIPVFESLPDGPPAEATAQAKSCLTVDVESLGSKPTERTFAFKVRDDALIGRHICPGDLAVLEYGKRPRNGDVVALRLDHESTLRAYVSERGKAPQLKTEKPRSGPAAPATGHPLQGVMIALIRRMK